MNQDYLSTLQYLGLLARVKRLSDSTIADGRKIYKEIDIGIEPNWFLVFKIILETGTSSISEISTKLKFSHPSVISIVQKMNEAGYLIIRKSKIDKRKQTIQLSKKSEKQLPYMQEVWSACEKATASIFSNNSFLRELERMEKALELKSFFERAMKYIEVNKISIKPFAPKHANKFESLNKYWLRKYFTIEPNDLKVLNDPVKYIIKNRGHILMAEYEKKVVGTVALVYVNNKKLELCRMAVNPKYYRKGIGEMLLKSAIEHAREERKSEIILYSNTQLYSAINLYKKFGFKKVQLEKKVIYERADIKMSLNITL